jgi:cell division protein FtsW (lipid II flippase)
MATSVYRINKGINRPIEFKGLKAQYIWYLGAGLVLLLVMFAIMYISGVSVFICLPVILLLGTALFVFIYRLSDKYGQFGLMKEAASRNVPAYVTSNSRKIFLNLKEQRV